jgi:pimeloyl-ACP methyl ester carboxylesterase
MSYDLTGSWEGSLGGRLRMILHFERGSSGGWKGKLDSPDQGAMGIPLDTVSFTGDSLRCELRAANAAYVAQMNATGDTLVGEWRQSGGVAVIRLARTAAPTGPRRPQQVLPPYPYDTLEVAYDNARAKGVRLAGTLTYPRGKGPFPTVLLITGSGLEDRDETVYGHKPFRVLADHLTRAGIAVLRVDDRGIGGSRGSNFGATTEDYASVEILRKRPEVDKKRIGLVGHSEGGIIAPMVVARAKDVAFVVLLAAPGLRGDSLMVLQTMAVRRALGAPEELIAREAALARRTWAATLAGDSAGVVRESRALVEAQLSGVPESQRGTEADRQALMDGAAHMFWDPWMRWFAAHDPAPVLKKVRVPVLAVNGSRDVQVTPRENLAAIQQALAAGGNKDATVQELPGLNHLFQRCTACTVPEYGILEQTFSPTALSVVSDWIRARMMPAK